MVHKKVMTSCGLQPYDRKRPSTYEGNENILNLVPPRLLPDIPKRYTGYRSSHKDRVVAERKKNRNAWRTMGHALEPLPNPDCYLKKGCGIKPPMHCVTKHLHDPCDLKPPLPKEPPMMNQKREADFIKVNAAENIMLKYCPNAIRRGIVDDKTGHFENLIGNNLEKKYVYKPAYGKTPKYLLKRYNKQYESEVAEDKYNGEFLIRGTSKLLCEDEKQALIWGLKQNWEAVNKEYICGLKASETNVQQRYKIKLEQEMDDIKKDIELLEKHKFVYVPRD